MYLVYVIYLHRWLSTFLRLNFSVNNCLTLFFSAQDVFTFLNHRRYAHLDVSPYISFFEIYNGKVRVTLKSHSLKNKTKRHKNRKKDPSSKWCLMQVYDLLNKKAKLRVLEDERQQVQVVGLEEVNVSTSEEVIKMIQLGSACRCVCVWGYLTLSMLSTQQEWNVWVRMNHRDKFGSQGKHPWNTYIYKLENFKFNEFIKGCFQGVWKRTW